MFHQSDLVPLLFLGECILTTTFLINRTPYPILNWDTPYKQLNEYHVDYSMLHTFWLHIFCINIIFTITQSFILVQFHLYTFVGYPSNMKGCHSYDIKNKNVFFVKRYHFSRISFEMK